MPEPDTITSPSNPRVRAAAALRNAAERRASGLTLVDGLREIGRALEGGHRIEEVFCADQIGRDGPAESPCAAASLLAAARDRGARVTRLSPRAFTRIAFGDRHEGLVAVVRFAGRPLAEDGFVPSVRPEAATAASARPIPPDAGSMPDGPVMIVEGIEKPGNLGAILRTADAAGLSGVIATGGGTDPANPAVIRASLGTVFVVPLAVATTDEAIDWCGRAGLPVFAAMPGASGRWHEADLARPAVILLGSEAHGLSPAWEQAAATGRLRLEPVALPMLGKADSLNVSATAAVLAYEALRQRSLRTAVIAAAHRRA
jgi:TrmH family RNA methyltransferase